MSVTRICTDSSWPSQPLPKAAGVAIEKGTPAHVGACAGAGTARFAPPCNGYHIGTFGFLTPAHRLSRGQLLSGVRRQKQDQGNDEQGENKFPHGCALLSLLRRADA